MLIEAVRRVETAAKEVLAAMNDGSLSCAEARDVLTACKPAMAALAAAQTSAARVVAGVERHGDSGVQVLADSAGLRRSDARSQIKTAQTIEAVPAVRRAVESGRVSQANAKRLAEAIERTSADAVESDAGLLATAQSMRPEQFTREARRWTADHQDDGGEGDYRRLRARRRVRTWDTDDGMVAVHGEFDPVSGRRIVNRLEAEARRLRKADKKQAGRDAERRSFEQCMADALDRLTADNLAAHHHPGTNSGADNDSRSRSGKSSSSQPNTDPDNSTGSRPNTGADNDSRNRPNSGADNGTRNRPNTDPDNSTGSRPNTGADNGTRNRPNTDPDNGRGNGSRRPLADICVVAHVDSDTGKLVAELPDGTRLPEAVLEELACNARLTGVVFDRKGKPIWRTESCRTATEAQRQILIARYGGCFHCKAHPALCQIHHIRPVSQGGSTRLDNMVPACWDCHQRIHHHKWQIQTTNGVHTLHPPGRMHHGPALAPEQPSLYLPGTDPPPEPRRTDTRALCATM